MKREIKVDIDLTDKQKKYIELLDKIRDLPGASDYDLWKYYQDRADEIKSRLWTTGTWLIALMTALLALSFQAGIIMFQDDFPPFTVMMRWPAGVIGLLGLLIAWHAYYAVKDHRDHIDGNWFRADYLKGNLKKMIRFSTHGGWVSLMFIGGLLSALYLSILFAAIICGLECTIASGR